MRLVATPVPAFALVNNTLYQGKAMLHIDRSAVINLDASDDSQRKCLGNLRYTASSTGAIKLECSDGAQAMINFTAVRETGGYGRGTTANGMASLAFGFEAADAQAYLLIPDGQRLQVSPDGKAQLIPKTRQ